MAVSVQTPLYPKNGMWHLGDPPSTFSSDSGGIPVSMAYPYPSPGLETAPMIPSYHHPLDHDSPAQGHPSSPGMNRGIPVGSKAAKIKRSMSTPNVRGQSSADAAAMALSADKRRNKLGYHRTSVACGHCRRRKIRCIPAPGDTDNRCSNCIRLKKACSFFPVDAQPTPEPKRKGSKAHNGPTGGTSETSSPSTTSGQVPDLPTTVPYPHNLNMPSIQDLGGPQMKRDRSGSFSPETKVVTTSRNFEYGHGQPNWMAPNVSPSSKTPPEGPQAFWRVNSHDSPITPAFSPYTPTSLSMPHPQNWQTQPTEVSPRDDMSWNVPQRSMSFNNLDNLHHQPQNQYAPYSQPHSANDNYTTKPRVMHSMYPPPIQTTGPGMQANNGPPSAHEAPQHPQSAGALPSFPSWQQQQPYPYPKSALPAGEGYNNWNGSHGGPLPVPVETTQAGHQGFQYGEQPGGMYYPGQQPGR